MTLVHICYDHHTNRPWWPTEQRLDIPADEKVVTDCCLRQLPAAETVCRLRLQECPVGGYGDYQEREEWPTTDAFGKTEHRPVNWFSYASYYDPTWRIECNAEGEKSCKQHKRFMRGLHLREWRYEAA
jgi:hypothetical protein